MPVLEEGQPLVFFIRHIEPNHTNHLQTVHGNVEISWVISKFKTHVCTLTR